jgi:hypothetical protein
MRSFRPLPLLLLVAACATPEVQSQRLKDGSWSFQCELGMDECVRRVQENCPNQRYRILEGSSETRMRDAPPFERAYHTSRLHLVCNDSGADAVPAVDGSKANAAPSVPAATAKLCSKGETRECVGVGACKGGQACLPDGTGYGSCECGPAAAPTTPAASDAASEAVTSPAGSAVTPAPSVSAVPKTLPPSPR